MDHLIDGQSTSCLDSFIFKRTVAEYAPYSSPSRGQCNRPL